MPRSSLGLLTRGLGMSILSRKESALGDLRRKQRENVFLMMTGFDLGSWALLLLLCMCTLGTWSLALMLLLWHMR